MNKVYLVTTGEGTDGDEWYVASIHKTREGAEKSKVILERTKTRADGSQYIRYCNEIEEWDLLD